MSNENEKNNFKINKKVKFILVDKNISSNRRKLLKEIEKVVENENLKKNRLISNQNFKESENITIKKISSWDFEKLKNTRDECIEEDEYINFIFDFSNKKNEINKTIKTISNLDFAWINKGIKKTKNNYIYFIFDINVFSKTNNVFSIEFINNFKEKVLKNIYNFKKYLPDKHENDYKNDKYVVNVDGKFKEKKYVVDIFQDNYNKWFKENFIYVKNDFINCFYECDVKYEDLKKIEILEKIYEKETLNPKDTKIIKIKDNEKIREIKAKNTKIIYLLVEGNDDVRFFEKLNKVFIFLNFRIIQIANFKFENIKLILNSWIKEDKINYKNIYLLGIFDFDQEGSKYQAKYENMKIKNINKVKSKTYKDLIKNQYKNSEKIKLEEILYSIKYSNKNNKINANEVKKDKMIKYLYETMETDTKNIIKSDFFVNYINLIKSIEEYKKIL